MRLRGCTTRSALAICQRRLWTARLYDEAPAGLGGKGQPSEPCASPVSEEECRELGLALIFSEICARHLAVLHEVGPSSWWWACPAASGEAGRVVHGGEPV